VEPISYLNALLADPNLTMLQILDMQDREVWRGSFLIFYVPPLQKSPCLPACNLRTIHDGSTRRFGYNCTVGQGTTPNTVNLLKLLSIKAWKEKGPAHERNGHFEVRTSNRSAGFQ
jgi:hypothetical protein